ncbi:AraC family transcriptional regulator [Biostraticola tofi]|nr:helix-turn-helix transcriptional regulator [Biostraticola tofi]
MRNVLISEVEDLPQHVLALGTDYPYGTFLDTHSHQRAQFLYGLEGLMEVTTEDGKWMVLPYSGVWIPAGKPHSVKMIGVSTRSLYIKPAYAPRQPSQCEVLNVSPLLHQLILSAHHLPERYHDDGRDETLIALMLHEIRLASPLPYFTPLPRHTLLAELCAAFLLQPHIHSTAEEWARSLNKSVRTFTRLFRQQLGLTFSEWRLKACLMQALADMSQGSSVTEISLNLGYESLSAFTTMFRKQLGFPPSVFIKQIRDGKKQ